MKTGQRSRGDVPQRLHNQRIANTEEIPDKATALEFNFCRPTTGVHRVQKGVINDLCFGANGRNRLKRRRRT